MAVIGRMLSCLVLCGAGASMVIHSPDNPSPDTIGIIGVTLLVVGAIGLIEIALGET